MLLTNGKSGLRALILTTAFGGAALAGTVTYNTTLLAPSGTSGAPGVYFGSGNINSNWTVDTETDGTELGLQTLNRFVGPVSADSNTSNNYTVPAGSTSGLTAWDFAYSIDLKPTGSSSMNLLSQINATIKVTDVNSSTVLMFNAVGNGSDGPGDDALVTSMDFTGDSHKFPIQDAASAFGAQNAENIGFFNPFLMTPFDLTSPDVYTITLSISGAETATDVITVTTVSPEPSTWMLLITGLAVAGLMARRSSKTWATARVS